LIDLCGLPQLNNGQLAGRSIAPLVENPAAKWNQPVISTFQAGNFVIHQNQWNYIKYNDGSQELYNIDEDENEIFNLAGKPEYKYMVDSLAQFLPSSWYTGTPEVIVDEISEDFSSSAWDAAFKQYNPTYTDNIIGSPFTVATFNLSPLYLDKYRFGGTAAIQGFTSQPSSVQGVTHNNGKGIAVTFRFRNTGESYMELPTLTSAGRIDLYIKNNNATAASSLDLQQFEDEWMTIHTFPVKPNNQYSSAYLDEFLSFDVHSPEPIKLRISRNDNCANFVNMFRIDVSPYGSSGIITPKEPPFFIQAGRKLIFSQPTNIFLYNMLGIMVYEGIAANEIELPLNLGSGLFIVKSNNKTHKIFI
jgi:hypothetical protein